MFLLARSQEGGRVVGDFLAPNKPNETLLSKNRKGVRAKPHRRPQFNANSYHMLNNRVSVALKTDHYASKCN